MLCLYDLLILSSASCTLAPSPTPLLIRRNVKTEEEESRDPDPLSPSLF